jgi:hypothetical protein
MTTKDAYDIYIKLGLTPDKAILAASQTAFETAAADANGYTIPFNSYVFKANNNVGGIMFVNQKDTIAGTPFPLNESKTAKYAKYKNVADSFKDHLRIVKPALDKSGTVSDYVANLKAQGYFTGGVKNYIAGMQRFEKELRTQLIPTTEKKKQ